MAAFFPAATARVSLLPPRGRWLATLAVCALWYTVPAFAEENASRGQEIYTRLCAECHGAQGEGVKDRYSEPLQGGRTLEDLTVLINDTMPQDDPEKCTGEDAKQVAEYIFQTFYSPAARARNLPPRVELSRLTVRQYANAVADLAGTFLGESRLGEQRGLTGRYFAAGNFRNDKKALERTDARIEFQFGESSPDPDKIGAEEFSVQWQGGLVADDSGDYEFCVKTENGVRLWVNDDQTPLIDARVQSGDQTEHRAAIRLLGGRVYPLRLEWIKSKSNVKTASISLQWQPPHGVQEVVPEKNLAPSWFPPVLVVGTDFPPDDSSVGYARGTTISKTWDQATTYGAIEVANKIGRNLARFAKCKDDDPNRRQCLQDFCRRFAERAFRRPLTPEQQDFFVDAHFAAGEDAEAAVKKSLLLVLKSPRFLYLGLDGGRPDGFDAASRLSFGLWDSLPDQELLAAASRGALAEPDEVARQARRMLTDPRTRSKLRTFFQTWLRFDLSYDLSKDKQLYPEFDKSIVCDLRTSLELALDEIAWGEAADVRRLLQADYLYVNKRLADFYGLPAPEQNGFHKVSVDPQQRAGLATHPFLLTTLAYHKSSSPIHRGVFLIRGLLGRTLLPPPIAVAPLDEGFDPNLTTRERVTLQTKPDTCQSCHSMINPLGFTLENYDAVGRYRGEEKSKPIDASGFYKTVAGERVELAGPRSLAEFLSQSEEMHHALVEQLFNHFVKQPVSAYGADTLQRLTESFAASNFNIQELLLAIMATAVLPSPQH